MYQLSRKIGSFLKVEKVHTVQEAKNGKKYRKLDVSPLVLREIAGQEKIIPTGISSKRTVVFDDMDSFNVNQGDLIDGHLEKFVLSSPQTIVIDGEERTISSMTVAVHGDRNGEQIVRQILGLDKTEADVPADEVEAE